MGLMSTFPAIFATLIYGPLSDRKGRKQIMKLPLLGSLINISITLATIYFELPVYVMTIGNGTIFINYVSMVKNKPYSNNFMTKSVVDEQRNKFHAFIVYIYIYMLMFTQNLPHDFISHCIS